MKFIDPISGPKPLLFEVPKDYYLVQLISADFKFFKLGTNKISNGFVDNFNIRNKLNELYPNYITNNWNGMDKSYDCLIVDRTLNLVVKKWYYDKLTEYRKSYEPLKEVLKRLKLTCQYNRINKLAIPMIGTYGGDKLIWQKVASLIRNIFQDTDIEILICK